MYGSIFTLVGILHSRNQHGTWKVLVLLLFLFLSRPFSRFLLALQNFREPFRASACAPRRNSHILWRSALSWSIFSSFIKGWSFFTEGAKARHLLIPKLRSPNAKGEKTFSGSHRVSMVSCWHCQSWANCLSQDDLKSPLNAKGGY